MAKKYLNNFDFLRIVFTVCIVVSHAFASYGVNWTAGNASVEFFFILSGFCLTYTIENQKSCEEFILKKIIRFWPLVCFTTLCMIFLKGYVVQEKILAPLFFLPTTGLFGGFIGSGSAWYVFVLFWVSIFYFYVIKNCNRVSTNICIGLLTFYGYVACVKYGWGRYETMGDLKLFTLGMARGIAGMGCGYFMAMLYQTHDMEKKKDERPSLKYTIFEILVLGYIVFSIYTVDGLRNRLFYVILFIVLIWLFLVKKGHISQYFEKNPCMPIAQYCLSVFLTHPVVIPLFQKSHFLSDYLTVKLFVTFMGCCLFGVLAHYAVEEPARKYLQAKFGIDKKIK